MPTKIDDDDGPFDPKTGLLRDGKSVHVSLMDSVRARGFTFTDAAPEPQEPDDDEEEEDVADSAGQGFAMQDSRPGGPYAAVDRRHVLSDRELADRHRVIADAHAAHDRQESERWRNPPNYPEFDADNFSIRSDCATTQQQSTTRVSGDAFTVSDEAKRLRDQAYADAEASDRDAWMRAK